MPVIVEGRAIQRGSSPLVDGSIVTPGCFHLAGMTARARPSLQHSTTSGAAGRRHQPGDGRQIVATRGSGRTAREKAHAVGTLWTTVVGVVAKMLERSHCGRGGAEIYASLYQTLHKHARCFCESRSIVSRVRLRARAGAGRRLDAAVFDAQMLEDTLSASLAEQRFSMNMIGLRLDGTLC